MVSGAVFDVAPSEFPCGGSGCSQDFVVDWCQFWPLEIGPVDIEGVLFPLVLKPKEFPRGVLVFIGVDVSGNIRHGLDSDGFRDVAVDEGISVAGHCRIIV